MRNRNPRRAYDAEGNEIAPPTIAEYLQGGYRTLAASCDECGHDALIKIADQFPLDLPFPDAALLLKCFKCGSKKIRVRLNMAEQYRLMKDGSGWDPDPQARDPAEAFAGSPWPRNCSRSSIAPIPGRSTLRTPTRRFVERTRSPRSPQRGGRRKVASVPQAR